MDEININFIFENNESIKINCNINHKIKDIIINKFLQLKNREDLIIDDITLYYKGMKLDNNVKADFFKNETNKINIFVIIRYKNKEDTSNNLSIKKNIIYCPKCHKKCLITFKGYRIDLHGCEKGHFISDLSLDKFDNYSLYDCSQTDINPFYCIHDKDKNKFSSYCFYCKKNLCTKCETEHQKHKIIKFDCIYSSTHSEYKNELQKKLGELKEKTDTLKDYIQSIIEKLNNIEKNLDINYNIYNHIINCYDYNLQNYYTLKNIYNIQFDDEIQQLNEIINENNEFNKYSYILKLYDDINDINQIKIKLKIEKEKRNNINNISTSSSYSDNILIKQTKVFGDEFVKNNKDKCKVMINNEEVNLQESYFLTDDDSEIILKDIKQITNMSHIFNDCTSLLYLSDMERWNTSSITNMSKIFYNCINLIELPNIKAWNTKSVTDMSDMFSGCKFLSLPDISNWDTSSVINMSYMFCNCINIPCLPDISKWDISQVKYLSHMFDNCTSLTEIPDIGKWNTISVTDMSFMFNNCIILNQIPNIQNWNFSNVNNISYMFNNCKRLSGSINLNEMDFSNISDKSNIFNGCPQTIIDNTIALNVENSNGQNSENNCNIY